uniref:Uncharacterized protein n=1 Tax=Nelumbo nucifera TaxID=4432 RepID=A0A822ZJK1_NELNU|nr:TPA_asm: hypothetical protein HUJ06_004508 [Nelumbo nucifera]DAD46294.1 TPA_asm: hypothetical protein HUJ06_004524 [Nelumbo nucifera]
MYGILVGSVKGGHTRSGPDSGSSSSGNNLYKTKICRVWEDICNCCYNSKCRSSVFRSIGFEWGSKCQSSNRVIIRINWVFSEVITVS